MFRGLLDIKLSELTNEFYNYEKIDTTCKENFHTIIIKFHRFAASIEKNF